MRRLALALVLLGSVIACGGEVAPSTSDKVSTKQGVDRPDPKPPVASRDEDAVDAPSSSGTGRATSSETPTEEEYPPPTWGPDEHGCFLAPGPDAPGECTVGTERECPPGIQPETPITSSSGATGSGYCQQRCVNVNGVARWSEPTNGGSMGACPYYDTNLFIGEHLAHCTCNTPLVLSFDDAPRRLPHRRERHVRPHAQQHVSRRRLAQCSDAVARARS